MDRKWWIPPQKQYRPETKRWYCRYCEKRTPIERNPEWDGSFEGVGKAPEWFVRCAYCKEKHWQNSGFDCPNCGWDDADEFSVIECGEPVSAGGPPWDIPSGALDWEETHKCPKCRHVFSFVNSNY
jgi:hypothetical protein